MADTNINETDALLVQGFKAAKEGHKEEAYQLFSEVVRRDPQNEFGWLYQAATTDDLSESYLCLKRVLAINPDNTKAQRGLERIEARLREEGPPAPAVTTMSGPDSQVTRPTYQDDVATRPPTVPTAPTARLGDSEVVSGFGYRAPEPEPEDEPTSDYNDAATVADDEDIYASGRRDNYSRRGDEEVPPPFISRDEPTPPPPFGLSGRQPFANRAANRPNVSDDLDDLRPRTVNYRQDADVEVDDEDDVAPPFRSRFKEQAAARGNRRDNRPRLASFGGGEMATDLNDVGRQRQGRNRLFAIVLAVLLLIILVALLLAVVLPGLNPTNNNNASASPAASVAQNTGASGTGAVIPPNPDTATVATTQPVAVTTAPVANPTTAVANPPATTQAAPATTAAPNLPATTAAPVATNPPPPPATTAPPVVTAPPAPAAIRPVIYQVKSGDNLITLARQYQTSQEAITAANSNPAELGQNGPLVSAGGIYANTRLVIPVQKPDFRGRATIVKNGETLDAIAGRFKVAPQDILNLNGLSAATDIKPGDPLLIP